MLSDIETLLPIAGTHYLQKWYAAEDSRRIRNKAAFLFLFCGCLTFVGKIKKWLAAKPSVSAALQ
jgi:hypothetical protein